MSRRAHAAAPVRLDLAGAWTDVPPFSSREGGRVIAAAIDLRVHVTVLPGGSGVSLVSDDLGATVTIDDAGSGTGLGSLPLLEAAVRRLPFGAGTVVSRSDVPKGSGLGSSGAFGVAAAAALSHARGDARTPAGVAELAWRIETEDAGIPGGKQDQYMAAHGGFQGMRFRGADVTLEPLALDGAFARELERATVLCYTGESRTSGGTIARVMAAYDAGDPAVVTALRGLRGAADAMADALAASDLREVAAVLDENWQHQQSLDPGMRPPRMAALESCARGAGAVALKAAGSGAGGCLIVLAPGRAEAVAAALREAGGEVLPVHWSREGVRTW